MSVDLNAEQREAILLEARADRLRSRKDDDSEDEGVWAAEFGLGSERFALPLERVQACLPLRGVAPVPQSRPGVVGITRFEGKIVAVFSLATLLGLKGWHRDPSVLLLVRRGHVTIGLDCEEIPRSVLLPFQALAAAPPAKGALRPLSLHVEGQEQPRLLQWIDPDLILEAPAAP